MPCQYVADELMILMTVNVTVLGLACLGSYLPLLRDQEKDGVIRSKLYCHTISSNIVVHKCPAISLPYIMEIPLNNPQTINIRGVSQPYTVRVTAMQANHCPGSLMFLFEKLKAGGEVDIRILYTGDFRQDYCTVLYCTVLYCIVLYCTVLYFTVLYDTIMYCTGMYYNVL